MTIEVKFAIGQDVEHFTGIRGKITAIFHRSGRNAYEMSYLKGDTLDNTSCEECELTALPSNGGVGFRKATGGVTNIIDKEMK